LTPKFRFVREFLLLIVPRHELAHLFRPAASSAAATASASGAGAVLGPRLEQEWLALRIG